MPWEARVPPARPGPHWSPQKVPTYVTKDMGSWGQL